MFYERRYYHTALKSFFLFLAETKQKKFAKYMAVVLPKRWTIKPQLYTQKARNATEEAGCLTTLDSISPSHKQKSCS